MGGKMKWKLAVSANWIRDSSSGSTRLRPSPGRLGAPSGRGDRLVSDRSVHSPSSGDDAKTTTNQDLPRGDVDVTDTEMRDVIVVGGGFAGIGAAKHVVKDPRVRVTLIDQNNYHQFQPLLYQVATSQLAQTDIAYPIRNTARRHPNFDV